MKPQLLSVLSWIQKTFPETRRRKRKSVRPRRPTRLCLERLEERAVPSAVPVVSLTAPPTALIGTRLNLSVDFKNASPTDAGYGPYVDVVLPATGTDGNDGIHYTAGSATYLGAAVNTTVITFDALGHALHPYAIDPNTSLPLVVNGTPGNQLVVFQLPFGSFTPGQPDAVVNFQADLSNLANLGNPLTVSADSGFEYGNSPTGATSVLGAVQTATVTPQLFTITKTYLGPEDETATGPDFPQKYEIDVSVAPGQTVTNFNVSDPLPGNLQFTAVNSATANGGTVTGSLLPSLSTPGGLLSETFNHVTGTGGPTDAKVVYTFYAPRDPNGLDGTQTPALATGGFTPSPNTATASGNWTPIDPRDPPVVATGTSNTVILTEKSIALQKGVADVQGNPTDAVAVGDQLRYSLNFQVSDFFAFDRLVATDLFSDGQHFDAGFTPRLTFTRDGVTHTLTFGADAYTLAPQSLTDGSDLLTFNISQAMQDAGYGDMLLGGSIPNGGTGGPRPNARPAFGPTTGVITFQTVVQQTFDVQQSNTGTQFVKAGDVLGDKADVSGRVLNYADLSGTAFTQTDGSAASVSLAQGKLTKTLYAINGVLWNGVGTPQIAAGDAVTYRLTYQLPHTNVDNQTITDYLPLPVFAASQLNGASVGAYAGGPPPAGDATYGPADTYHTIRTGFLPSLSTQNTPNSVTFDFGSFHDLSQRPSTIDLLFTVTASDAPFADGLFLTNEAHESEQSVNDSGVVGAVVNDSSAADSIIQVRLTEPQVNIEKGVVGSSDVAGAYTAAVAPTGVSFSAPGSASAFSGVVSSAGLAVTPVGSGLTNVQAGDRVRFAVVVENVGSGLHGAFNVVLKDTLPAGFDPASLSNLQVHDGAGNVIGFTSLSGGLFDPNGGIELTDPSATQGALAAYDSASGANIAVVTYDLTLASSVTPGQKLDNTADLTNYASTPSGPDFLAAPLGASADVTVQLPSTLKSLVGTSFNTANNANDQVVIGEKETYSVTVTIPQGTTPNAAVVDALPAGLGFVQLDGVTTSSGVSMTGTGSASVNGQTVTFNLGTITDADANPATPDTITLTFDTVVQDVIGNRAGVPLTNSAQFTWNGGANKTASTSAAPVTVIEPNLSVAVTPSPAAGEAGTTVTYTVSVTNNTGADATDAYEVNLVNALPSDVTYVAGSLRNTGGVAPTTLTANGGAFTATYGELGLGQSSTFTFQVTLDGTVTPGEKLTDTANTTWTSLPGVVAGERTGAGGVDDYAASKPGVVTVFSPGLTKSIVQTSELSTTGANVAVGEIVRYHLVATIPEGTENALQVIDALPPGMRFLNDNTATAAFVSPTGADLISDTLPLIDGGGNPLSVIGSTGAVTPTYVLPGSAVAGGGADGAAVTFNFGNVKNLAIDGSNQLIVVEFNALVDNVRGNTAGHPLNNSFTVDVSGAPSGNPSNTVTTTVVEPKLTLTKAVKDQTDNSTTTGDAGDVVQYTYTLKNTGNATAFNVNLADVLPTDLGNAGSLSVSVTGGAATGQDTSGTSGNNLSVLFASLDAGATVTVKYTATIQNTVTPNEQLDSTASATWASLPGAKGTVVNPTGSSTPGAAGSPTGERTGPGVGAPNPPDNYLATKDAPLTVLAPPSLQKMVASTSLLQTTGSNVAVGETVTYDMTFTLSEATYATLSLTDALPTGLTYISSQVDAIGADISGSALAVGASGAPGGQNVIFQFTDATHTVVDAADNTPGPQHQITVEVTALVADVSGNSNNKTRTNNATLNYGPGVLTASAPVTVVEPQITVTKSANKATADAGEPITYTVTVKNNSPAAPAFNVDLTDLLDAEHLTLDSIGTLPAGVTLASGPAGEVHVTVAELDAGQSVSFQYVAQIQGPPTAGSPAPGAAVPNTATVNSYTTLPTGGRTEPAVSGGASVTVNSSTISGYVYDDSVDNNGAKENGEAGLRGIGLTLSGMDDLGNTVSVTATTNASGFYQFTKLRPSDGNGYTISQDDATLPPAYLDGKNQAGDVGGAFGGAAGAVFDDANRSIVIPADSNQAQTDYNFGKLQPATVSGYSYEDVNDNGLRSASGEPGIGVVSVTLSGGNDLGAITPITVQTDGAGYYHFDGLRPGTYTVAEAPPAGYLNGLKTRGDVAPIPNSVATNAILGVAVSAGGVAPENDFAHLNPAVLSGYVYRDDNNDGRMDNGEPGLAGVTVTLSGVDDQGNAVPAGVTAPTDLNGFYHFDNLRPGTYTVTETQPVPYAQGQNAVGQVTLTQAGQTFAAGVRGPGVDMLSGVKLAEGDGGVQYDFGERGASVSGTVYLDGVPANGLGGVTVTLEDGHGGVLSTIATDGGGHYHFDNLPAGPYMLVETVPTGAGAYTGTPLYAVGTPTTLSVNLPTTGLTNENFDLNTGSLAGTVYQDVNDSDALDAGDARLTGVAVTLTGTDVAGNVVNRSLPTDGSGNYDFTGLLPADANGYTLVKTTPAGYIDNPQTVGTVAGSADGAPANGFGAINAVALAAGQNGVGYNFGEVLPSALAGFVYADANDNGAFEPNAPNSELGLGGVTVTLTGLDDRGNTVHRTTTTLSDGGYSFGGLRPAGAGGYTLTESPPPGPTAYLPGTDGLGADQNNRPIGGTVGTRVLSAVPLGQGVHGANFDFAELSPATVAGVVYLDSNDNGTPDRSEQTIGGVTLTLSGVDDHGRNFSSVATSDPTTGVFSFAGLRPGTYQLIETQPTGYLPGRNRVGAVNGVTDGSQSPAGNPTVDTFVGVRLNAGDVSVGNDFGELLPNSLSGHVYSDLNNDGTFQPGVPNNEPGLPIVSVTLTGTDDLGHAVRSTITTDGGGLYQFTGLRPSDSNGYVITEAQPAGYLQGKDHLGSDGGDGSTQDAFAGVVQHSGDAGANYDFGELAPASLSGFVYRDDDNNGVFEPGETPLGAVSVTLSGFDDRNQSVLQTVKTGVDGSYRFGSLRPAGAGGYTITETPPAAYLPGQDTVGVPAGGAANSAQYVLSGFQVTPGFDGTNNDFAELQPQTVSGVVFADANGDQVQDHGEPGVGGAVVTLTGLDYRGNPVTLTATTNPDGSHAILKAPPSGPAGYQLESNQPSGYGPPGPTRRVIPVTSGSDTPDQNFALPTSTIRGVVYQDLNLDGVQEPTQGESGLGGVVVTLTGVDANGKGVTATAVTAADGSFSYTGLLAGTYRLHEAQPAGYYNGFNRVGTAGGVLGAQGSDNIGAIPLAAATTASDYEFGEFKPGSASGYVFLDANDDGRFDGSDAGIPGVRVTIGGVAYAGTSLARPLANADVVGGLAQTTDASGHWAYDLLPPGQYVVTETPPAGYLDSGLENADPHGSDIVAGQHAFSDIGVDPDPTRGDLNFGHLRPGSVGGVVYLDNNANGFRDPGEPGLPGVMVTLSGVDDHGRAVLLTATTAADGSFDFTNLRPGRYDLLERQPTGFVAGLNRAGGLGGTAGVDKITDLVLSQGGAAADYLFAQTRPYVPASAPPSPQAVVSAQDILFSANPITTGAESPTQPLPRSGVNGGGASFDPRQDDYARLTGYVYFDHNNDGRFEQADEQGIAGVAVTLSGVSNRGQAVARTALTDVDGYYDFERVPPGTYQVVEARPEGWLEGRDALGTVNGATTGAAVAKGEMVRVALPKGGEGRDYDFGELAPAAVEGSVLSWGEDVDGSLFMEGLGDLPVFLTGVDDHGAPVRRETRTGDDGSYRFDHLRPGAYSVQTAEPKGHLPLKAKVGTRGGREENARCVAGVALRAGECGRAYDFEMEAAPRVQRNGSRPGLCLAPAGAAGPEGPADDGDEITVDAPARSVGAPLQETLEMAELPENHASVGGRAVQAAILAVAVAVGLEALAPRKDEETPDKPLARSAVRAEA